MLRTDKRNLLLRKEALGVKSTNVPDVQNFKHLVKLAWKFRDKSVQEFSDWLENNLVGFDAYDYMYAMAAFGCLNDQKRVDVWDALFAVVEQLFGKSSPEYKFALETYYTDASPCSSRKDVIQHCLYVYWHDTPVAVAIRKMCKDSSSYRGQLTYDDAYPVIAVCRDTKVKGNGNLYSSYASDMEKWFEEMFGQKQESHCITRKRSTEASIRFGSDLWQQTEHIVNKAVRDVMFSHPLCKDSRFKVTDIEIYADDEHWVEGSGGTVDFCVQFFKSDLFAVDMEVSFCPKGVIDGEFRCDYEVILNDDSKVRVRPYRVEKDFTVDYKPTQSSAFTYLSNYLYDSLKEMMFEALEHLAEGLEMKGILMNR